MRVYGVPKEGKRVKFSDGLSLVLPFGTAYAKDDDGKYNILYYKTTPAGYRNGVFTADDEEEVLWSINGLQKNAVVNFESDEAELTPASVREEMPAQLRGVAQTLVGEDNSSKEPYEPGSSTKVEETEGGFVIRSGITVNAAGGSYQLLDLGEKAVGAVVKKGVQIFGLTMYFTYLLLAVEDCPEAPLFSATLRAPDDPDFYEKTLVPLLKTAWLESTGKSDKRAKSKIQRNAAPVVASLDFSEGERVRTGEFSILVPGGMCWSGEIAPETRYLTSIPASVTFDNPDWDDASAIRFTVQTGQKIPAIQAALDTPEGEGQVQALLRSMNISQQGTADSSVGSVTTVARGPDYYICYSLGKETGIDYLYRYFLFSRTFVYTGMYIGWKAGLKDALEQHTKILEQWLGTVRYEGDAGAELARYGRTQFGKYAAEDGKLNAVLIAQLFSTDVLFFNEDDFKENGLKNGVHINSLKLSEHPLLAEKRDVLAPEIANLLLELDAVPELRVSKEKIHKKLLPLLFNDHAVPLTGMTVMNLLAYHMLHIQENGPDGYTAIIDRNLVAGIPDAYRYAAEFLRQLRLYNGKSGAFTVTFANAMNFDTPIQGALRPVDGAAQPKSGCRIRVEENGSKQELEAAEEGEQPAAEGQRPVQELEQDLPPEFASRMRKFSADISSRLAQVCETLEASDYSDLTNTDDVLSRVMDQAGDYGLAWGIFNFYNVFTLGDRDSTFSFERAGEKDFSDPDGPAYRIDEQYEEYAEGDLDFQPDAFPKQLAERLRGITEDEIYQALLEQAVEAQRKGYTIVDEERKRIEKQKKELEKVPFDPVSPVKLTGSAFVLTGEFEHMDNDRDAIKAKIQAKGGRCTQSISGKTDYLVIGGLGGFGDRKLDQVREQRAKGSTIKIIREEDLFAALEGRSAAPRAPEKAASAARTQKISTEPGDLGRGGPAGQRPDYVSACQTMETAKTVADLRRAAKAFEALGGYRDSSERKAQCLERAKELEQERQKKKAEEKARQEAKQRADYDSACQAMEKAGTAAAFRKAAKAFEALGGYQDSSERRAQCLEQAGKLEEEQKRRKAEEKARLEREQAEKAAAERARQQELDARRKKLLRKIAIAALLAVAAVAALLGVKRYLDNAPYRELAADIDAGTFHYSRYAEEPYSTYFLWHDSSKEVIAEKLTDLHREDDVQSAVNLIGSLPPDEGSFDYYIDGMGIYMTDDFRQWFADRTEETGTEVIVRGAESEEDRKSSFYQMGDFLVQIRYDISDPSEPSLMQALVIEPEEGTRVTLGANRNSGYYGDQHGIR